MAGSKPPLTPALVQLIRVIEWMGPATRAELAVELKQDSGTVGQKLKMLKEQGWVEAYPHPKFPNVQMYRSKRSSSDRS